MREGWISDNLSNCIKLKSGIGLTAKNMIPGDFPVFGGNGIAGYHNEFNLTGEHLIIGRVGALCGNARYVNDKIWLTDNAFRISEFKYDFDLEFLNYLLNHINLRTYARQAAQPVISNSSLKNVNLSFPKSLPEQKQIVAILDQTFEAIDQAKVNIEKNIENAKELFQSKLNEIFSQKGNGWETEKMVDLCSILTCGVASTPKYVDETVGVAFLSAQNVRNGKVALEKYKYISKEFHQHLTKKNKPQKGDILYSRVGAKFGEAGVVEHDFEFSVYVSVTLIRPLPDKLNNYYFKHYLNSPLIKSLAKSSITSSGVPNLNVNTVREFPVYYPPIEKQVKIVNKIEKLEAKTLEIIKKYERKNSSLEELKKSILQKAFAGELTGKEVAVEVE